MEKNRKYLIHPSAILDPGVEMGEGVTIGPYVTIGKNVHIGNNTQIDAHTVIYEHTTIGANCHIYPNTVIGTPPQDIAFGGELSHVVIGDNTVIREFVNINRGSKKVKCITSIGSNCFIMAYVHIAHDCQIGNNVIMANAATLAGHIIIEDFAILGGLTAVHQFVRIGKYAFIGGCSGIPKDIPPFSKSSGNRVKLYGINTVGLKRHGFSNDAISKLKQAYKILLRSHLNTTQALEVITQQIKDSPEVEYLVSFIRDSERGICK